MITSVTREAETNTLIFTWNPSKIVRKLTPKLRKSGLKILCFFGWGKKEKDKFNLKERKANQFLEFLRRWRQKAIPRKCVHGKSVHPHGRLRARWVWVSNSAAGGLCAGAGPSVPGRMEGKGKREDCASWSCCCRVSALTFLRNLKRDYWKIHEWVRGNTAHGPPVCNPKRFLYFRALIQSYS